MGSSPWGSSTETVCSPQSPDLRRHGGPSGRLLILAEHNDASWRNILALSAQQPHDLLFAVHHMLHSIAMYASFLRTQALHS